MKELHRTLLSELSSLGLSARLRITNGNHVRIEWHLDRQIDFIITSLTPGDRRAVRAARAEIRRHLKRSGVRLDTTTTQRVPLSGPTAQLRNELRELRSEETAHAGIRTIETELAWRQHSQIETPERATRHDI